MKPTPHDPLQDRLKSEAANGPAFSDSLHQRIMADIRRVPTKQTIPPQHRFIPSPLLTAASIFAGLGLVWLLSWQQSPTQTASQITHPLPLPDPHVKIEPAHDATSAATPIPIAAIAQLPSEAAGPVLSKIKSARFAYLDQDAKRLKDFVMDQLTLPVAGMPIDKATVRPTTPRDP